MYNLLANVTAFQRDYAVWLQHSFILEHTLKAQDVLSSNNLTQPQREALNKAST